MIRLSCFLTAAACFSVTGSPAQSKETLTENCAEAAESPKTGQNVRILFWNLENLFDYKDDTLTEDEEFTGAGTMHWTYTKLQLKVAHTAKTILAAGEWSPPAILGMCEVENRYVLNKLVYHSPLTPFGYRIIHRDSPDNRGIDVAMLYRPEIFTPVHTLWIPIRFPFDTTSTTRDILYVKGLLKGCDTIHLFVNHWPSRRGGEAASAPRRNHVASVLRQKADSIISNAAMQQCSNAAMDQCSNAARHHYPCIIILGDFNDEPENESLKDVLQARLDTNGLQPHDLVNLLYLTAGARGSHKFREHWGLLDQIIVSGILLDTMQHVHLDIRSATIFKPSFLLEDDLRYLDKKPKRTFLGPRYMGGFSDHLPVFVDLEVRADREEVHSWP